jgi:hypothetical protein
MKEGAMAEEKATTAAPHTPGPCPICKLTRTGADNPLHDKCDRLIAAAPAMYAALHAYFTDNTRFHKMASDALALVDGR